MRQSQVEIKRYSIAYFGHVAIFEVVWCSTSVKGLYVVRTSICSGTACYSALPCSALHRFEHGNMTEIIVRFSPKTAAHWFPESNYPPLQCKSYSGSDSKSIWPEFGKPRFKSWQDLMNTTLWFLFSKSLPLNRFLYFHPSWTVLSYLGNHGANITRLLWEEESVVSLSQVRESLNILLSNCQRRSLRAMLQEPNTFNTNWNWNVL